MYLILRRSLIVNFAVILALGSSASAAPECHAIFGTEAVSSFDVQKNIESLAAYRLQLDDVRAEGQSSTAISAMQADYSAKETLLFKHVKISNMMTPAELREKFKESIIKLQNERKSKEEEKKLKKEKKKEQKRAIRSMVIDGAHVIFHPIEPGSFTMNSKARNKNGILEWIDHPVTLTKPFEMMATPVTQIIWREIAELANSKIKQGLKAPLNPDPSEFKGDLHPVESVSLRDVEQWLESLNRLSAEGTPELVELIAGHQPGDKYRLPTEAEWEFVVTNRGANNGVYNFLEINWLTSHAWFVENAESTTHAVAQKTPLKIGTMEFFDIIGNVSEMTSDTLRVNGTPVRGGIDPHHYETNSQVIYKGANLHTYIQEIGNVLKYSSMSPDFRKNSVGFRLIREVRDSGGTP